MATTDVGRVGRRVLLVQLHVADQRGSRVAALEQVVTQDPVLGKAAGEGVLERVDVVDSLADERSLAEDVLVDVGDGARIGVDARVARMQPRVPRATRAGQADAHARLQDSVSFGDRPAAAALAVAAKAGPVQRVRHHADQLPRRIAGQLRVGVERDHVLHAPQRRGIADDVGEAVRPVAAQQRVQVRELSPLALVAHPQPFLRVPPARAVEEEEDVAGRAFGRRLVGAAVLLVQALDPGARGPQQRLVLRHRFGRRVAEVGQQAEMQMGVAIGEEADLQRLDQPVDAFDAGEHRGDDDQRARRHRQPEREIHARQRLRLHQQGRQPVHDADGQVAAGERQQDAENDERGGGGAAGLGLRQQRHGDGGRDRRGRAEVQETAGSAGPGGRAPSPGKGGRPRPARVAVAPCRSGRSRRERSDRHRRCGPRRWRHPRAPAGSPGAPRRTRTACCSARSPPRRAGSGRASRNPSCRRVHRDLPAASARRCSSPRRTRANPSIPGTGGCRWCC